MDESTRELSEVLNTEIEIKEERLDEQDEYSLQEDEPWSMEPANVVSIKQEEEEIISSEHTLQPVSAINVMASQEEDIKPQQPFILIKMKVNGRKKKSCLQGYATLSEIMRKNRERVAMYRAKETQEQRQARLKKDRERKARQRVAERSITEIYRQRLQEQRERTARKRSNWTPEQRQENLRKDRKQKRMKRLEQKLSNLMVETAVNQSFRKDHGMYSCDLCNYTCESDYSFKEHYFTHFNSNNFVCNYCGEGFSYQFDLTEHELAHTNGKKPYKCELCLSEHTSLANLSKHCCRKHRADTKSTNFECEVCHETFPTRQAQNVHLKVHPGIEAVYMKTPFLCEICGKIVTTFQSFQNHYRIHTGEKPYVCKECGKSFTAYVGLHYHSRIHTGEKPYECSECGKAFAQRSSYVVHKRTHTGERPFICKVCEKSYITSTLLKIHMNKHTDV